MTTKASSAITQRLLEFAKSQPTVKYHNANSIEIEQCVFCSSNLVEEDHGEYSPCLHVEAMTNKEPSAVEHDEATKRLKVIRVASIVKTCVRSPSNTQST